MVNMATRPFGESLTMGPNEEPVANYMRRSTYGNPKQAGWYGKNLVTVYSPSGVPFVVHRETAPAFQGFLGDLEASGYSIRPSESSGYNYRTIRGGSGLSQHAFGNAIDINSLTNPMQKELKTDMPENVRDMASKWGLEWGGDWNSTKDAMHFEWTGVPVVAGVGAVRGEEAVKQLQQSLAAQGLYDGEIDGVAGPATKAALTAYNAVNDGAQPQSQPAFNMASVSPTTAKLAGVMLAEARGEGREGMAGVGNVVVNRTHYPGNRFPGTVDDVINSEFAKPLGPNDVSPEEWQEAVQLAMGIQAGVVPDNTGGAVYFANPATSNANAYGLIKASGPVTTTIGNHVYHAGDKPVQRPSPVANIVEARQATQPNMAATPPPNSPPVMPATPPPFSLEGTATTGQPAGASAVGVLPPAVPTPRPRPGGGGPVAPPPVMTPTPPPFQLSGSATTGQGSGARADGQLPPAVPTPRSRPDNGFFDIDAATMVDENGNYLSTGEVGGVPTPPSRPTMATTPPVRLTGAATTSAGSWAFARGADITIKPPPNPAAMDQPVVKPTPVSMETQAPAPKAQAEPSGVTFISPATIANLGDLQQAGDLKMGEASESITAPMSPIEAAIQDFEVAQSAPTTTALATPAGAMDIRSPVQQAQQPTAPQGNMATSAPPQSGGVIQTTQAPAANMASTNPGGWFSKLFTPNTSGSKGFTPSGGGVNPNGIAYKYGSGPLGTGYTQWQDSNGRTVTVAQNTFGQPGYLTGYG